MPYPNQPIAIVAIDADMASVEAINVAPCVRDAGQAAASVTTHGPAAIWVNQILWINETDVGKWTSQLDASIRIKSWETL